jgi:pre-rRNA-processing protein TSR1
MELEPTLLAEPTSDRAESLTSRLDPDTLANEQTWPTDEELRGVDDTGDKPDLPPAIAGTTPKRVKKVPKGTSAYQAAWIVDDSDEGEEEGWTDDEEKVDAMSEDDPSEDEIGLEKPEFMEEDETDGRKSVAFRDLDVDEEDKQYAVPTHFLLDSNPTLLCRLESWRASRTREDQTDMEFPDEVDTPKDIPARTRFQRFRGLRSFRTSPWDPFENLPVDYGRIFRFEDYEKSRRKVYKPADDGVSVWDFLVVDHR